MKINHPHDGLFGFTFNDKASVIQFAKQFFPVEIVQNLVLDSFQKEDTSYINEELQTFYADKVWTCLWKGSQKQVKISFLFEHKSYVENPWLQLLRYLLEGYRSQIQQQQAANRKRKAKKTIQLTVIIPVLFYHGEGTWHYRSFDEYFDLPDPSLKKFVPSFQYLLTDLANHSDEELLAMEIGFLVSTLLLLKHKNDKKFIKQYHQEIFIFVEQLRDNPSTDSFLEVMIVYILQTYKLESMEVKEIIENLPPKVKNKAMSTYDMLIAEGVKKGKLIGLKEGVFKTGINVVLTTLVDIPQLKDEQIANISRIDEFLVQQIRNSFKEKKPSKASRLIIEAYQNITNLNTTEKTKIKKLVKKYYLRFNKKA